MMASVVRLDVGQEFRSFTEFERDFKEYCKETKQIFCVSASRTVDVYNKTHAKQLPKCLKYAYVKYTCKCSGRERLRGKGERVLQR